ncbi:MAG: protease modulator HflC [Thermoguttaceae bacterium]|jgi:membrane protease subunit HflC|nr:protease modulator HflC [Thermoguttaceae bacterium]
MATIPPDAGPPEQRRSFGTIVWRLLFALVVVGLLIAYGSSYTVQEGHSAIVTQFGQPVQVRTEPGLYGKWPWPIEQVHFVDMRSKYHNTPFTETFTYDRKNVVMLNYVVWRVENPLLFFQSLGTQKDAEQKLDGMVTASKNFHMGNFELSALVSTTPGEIRTPEIERLILNDLRKDMERTFGIAVEQVGVKRIAYPEDNMEAVLEQMRAERRSEQGELRARGTKEAEAIRNEGMVQAEQILRAAREEAGKIVGQAEQQAAETYAKAHQLDPDFYRFWRSMQVIRNTLGAKSTVVLRSDQEPFRELFESVPATGQPLRPAGQADLPALSGSASNTEDAP